MLILVTEDEEIFRLSDLAPSDYHLLAEKPDVSCQDEKCLKQAGKQHTLIHHNKNKKQGKICVSRTTPQCIVPRSMDWLYSLIQSSLSLLMIISVDR